MTPEQFDRLDFISAVIGDNRSWGEYSPGLIISVDTTSHPQFEITIRPASQPDPRHMEEL